MATLDTYNNYAWPNRDSYRAMGIGRVGVGPNGQQVGGLAAGGLRHGALISVSQVAGATRTDTWGADFTMRFNYALVKRFQFNPPEFQFDMQSTGVAPAESEASGGAAGQQNFVLGGSSTGLSLIFNRELEVFRAKNGGDAPAEFGRYGVQLDILDVFKVILGADQVSKLEGVSTSGAGFNVTSGTDSGPVSEVRGNAMSSLNQMHKYLFDTVNAAAEGVISHPIGVIINNDLAFYGHVMGMSYDFKKFTKDMVPTLGSVGLKIEVRKTGTAATATSMFQSSSSTGTTGTAGNTGQWSNPASAVGGMVPTGQWG
jgi:hypothetical protein